MDNSNIFSFSIQLTQFESEVLTCLCGCGSNVSSVFKAFAMLFRSVPVVCHPMASPRSGRGLLYTSVLRCMVCYLASDPCLHSSGVRSKIMGLLSWTPPSLWFLWYFPVFWTHFSVLWPKTWGFSYSSLLCPFHDCMYLGPSGRRIEVEKKINGGFPYYWDCWKQKLQHYLIRFQCT